MFHAFQNAKIIQNQKFKLNSAKINSLHYITFNGHRYKWPIQNINRMQDEYKSSPKIS